eukprot:11169917-Lingulodinium_polyedra.AAC.1
MEAQWFWRQFSPPRGGGLGPAVRARGRGRADPRGLAQRVLFRGPRPARAARRVCRRSAGLSPSCA